MIWLDRGGQSLWLGCADGILLGAIWPLGQSIDIPNARRIVEERNTIWNMSSLRDHIEEVCADLEDDLAIAS